MKKVGIMTFCYEHNYGAVLQSLALFKNLENLNLDVEVLRYITKEGINNDLQLLNFEKGRIFKQLITAPLNWKKFNNFKKFIDDNIKISHEINNVECLKKYVKKFNALVTGSDQVWNDDITKESKDVFFLKEISNKNTKLYSYAASFGKENLSKEMLNYIKKTLIGYRFISVREQSGVEIIKQCGIDSLCVVDPTLLLSAKEWNKYEKEYDLKEDYILVYTMEKNISIVNIANYVSNKMGLKIVHFRKEKNFDCELKKAVNAGPGEFLTLFKNAKYVITNSFHGLVFSLIYNKEFISIPHNSRNTRQENLLDIVDLKNRMVSSIEEYKKIENEKINYKCVNDRLNKKIEESKDYIKRMVEDINE